MPFLTVLYAHQVGWKDGREIWELDAPLVFRRPDASLVVAPPGFQTDFCSVPRHPAFVFGIFGARLDRQGTMHDYVYRIDSDPLFTYDQANLFFKEVCADRYDGEADGPEVDIMFSVLVACGTGSYHKLKVVDKLV
jgi:hypothetical protein